MRRTRAARRAGPLAISALVLCTGGAFVGAAQEAPPEVLPIPLSEFARETERVTHDLRQSRELVQSTEKGATARRELQLIELTIRELETELSRISSKAVARVDLEDAGSYWARIDAKLERVREDLDRHARALAAAGERLERTHEVWARSRELAESETTPVAVLGRLESVGAEIDSVRDLLADELAAVLVMLDRLTSDRLRAAAALDRIAAAKNKIRRELFRRSAPPIWSAFGSGQQSSGLSDRFRKSWRHHLEGLDEFLVDTHDLLVLHLLGTILLGILFARLGRQAASWVEEDADFGAAARILSRPVSAAIVVSLSSTVVLYPRAPSLVWEIAYVAAALPLLVLARSAVPSRARGPLYALVGLFVLIHLFNLAPADPLLQRLIHLAVAVLALAGALRLLVVNRATAQSEVGAWWRAAIAADRLAALMLAISVVASFFGWVSLASLLVRSTINSSYLAVAFLASSLILEGAVATGLRTPTARTLRMVRDHPKLLRRRLMGSVRIALALIWVMVTLMVLYLLDPAVSWGRAVLGNSWSIGALELSLGSITAFVFTIWVSIQVSRFVRFVLEEDLFPRVSLARGLPGTISMLARYGILAIGFLIAVAAAGIELSSFAILAGALGVGIGFGLQNVVNNFVSGLILAFERPVQIGDTIEVGQLLGEVKKIGIRASTVRTYEGAEVIVPNGDLVSAQVTNWTLSDRRRRIKVPVGVAYGTDPESVMGLLREVAGTNRDVLETPAPVVLFLGFGESSLDFDLRFWTARFERWREVRSEITVAVNNALKQAGFEIPFPQRDLHLRSVDQGAARALSADGSEPAD